MSDLVARLRESVRACRALDRSQLLEEAAGEIERLRGEVVLWTAAARLTQPEASAIKQAIASLDGRHPARELGFVLERLK